MNIEVRAVVGQGLRFSATIAGDLYEKLGFKDHGKEFRVDFESSH